MCGACPVHRGVQKRGEIKGQKRKGVYWSQLYYLYVKNQSEAQMTCGASPIHRNVRGQEDVNENVIQEWEGELMVAQGREFIIFIL